MGTTESIVAADSSDVGELRAEIENIYTYLRQFDKMLAEVREILILEGYKID